LLNRINLNGGMYITNEKLQKIEDEIIKVKAKIANYTAKLRKLEGDKTALIQAEYLAIIKETHITPDEFRVLVQSQKGQSGGNKTEPPDSETNKDEEDTDEQI